MNLKKIINRIEMKKIAIIQSNYLPWKGYFDLISSVDELIFYDEMQYTKRDWRNRNVIKTNQGLLWLSIPIKVKGKYNQTINESIIDGVKWKTKHWKTIIQCYKKSEYFDEVAKILEPFYKSKNYEKLSELNQELIKEICKYLGINTILSNSIEYGIINGKTERLIDLCIKANADEYITGPAAKEYIKSELFDERSIKLKWFKYEKYPIYNQLYGKFVHEVSIIDLLFNCGPNSIKFIKNKL
jgi:hypothetical protein